MQFEVHVVRLDDIDIDDLEDAGQGSLPETMVIMRF